MEEAEEYQAAGAEIVPARQETIMFHGKPLIGVVLPDGRPGFVLRSFCDNLQLDRIAQARRIRRTEAIADDLIGNVRIEYPGGPAQHAQVLTLRAVGYWLATIDASRVRAEVRADVLYYQREAVDALYLWAQSRRALPAPTGAQEPTPLPEAEASNAPAIIEPSGGVLAPIEQPGPEATHAELATYHEHMALWHRWQADHHAREWRGEVETWRGEIESRLEGEKETLRLIPELIERLGPQTLTTEQQENIRGMTKRLTDLTAIPYQTIYWELAQAFKAPRYSEILERDYQAVCNWFQRRIEQAKKQQQGGRQGDRGGGKQ